MAAKKGRGGGGLAVLLGPPEDDDDEPFEPAMYDDDLADDDELGDDGPTPGAFEAYADVIFNPESDPESKAENLRLAIETVMDERGR